MPELLASGSALETAARQSTTSHGWHLLAAVGFLVLTLGGISLAEAWQHRRRTVEPRGAGGRSLALVLIAVSGGGAAAVHAVVMPVHLREAFLYGAFFAVAAVTQLGFSALLLWRPSRALVAVAVVGNAAVIGLWLVTRLVSIPLGPAAGVTESVGGLDVMATLFELGVVVVGITVLLRVRLPRRSQLGTLRTPMGFALSGLALLAVSVTAVLAPPS